MPYLLTIQYPYDHLTITLSDATTIITTQTISKFQAIQLLLPTLQTILTEHSIHLSDISCIGINTGPGPFNTLRSIIATANSIAFSTNIPLVGCNGLELLMHESAQENTVVILDAFGNDVYYAMTTSGKEGYDTIEHVIAQCNALSTDHLVFIGNGAIKHQAVIKKNITSNCTIDSTCTFASPQSLVDATFKKWTQGATEKELFPLYFASPVVKS